MAENGDPLPVDDIGLPFTNASDNVSTSFINMETLSTIEQPVINCIPTVDSNNVEQFQQSAADTLKYPVTSTSSSSGTFLSVFSLNCCRFCSMKFKSYGLLFKHITEVHLKYGKSNTGFNKRKITGKESQRQTYSMRFCSRKTSADQSVTEKVPLEQCRPNESPTPDGCELRYNNDSKKLKSQPQQKPFECRVCRCTFARRDTLKKHMSTHTGEKPFACKVCGRMFSRKDKRKAHEMLHMKRHTGSRLPTTVDSSSVPSSTPVPQQQQQQQHPDALVLSSVVEELLANCVASVSPLDNVEPKLTSVTVRTDSETNEQNIVQMFAASSNSNTGDQSLATSFFLCSICGAEASDLVSGVPCCNRCRQFFEENCNNLNQYCCLGNSHCIIDAATLNSVYCQFCYLQKCFAAGMKPISVPNSDFASADNGRNSSSQFLCLDSSNISVSCAMDESSENKKSCESDQTLSLVDSVLKRVKQSDNQQQLRDAQIRLDKITMVIDNVIKNCSKCWACKNSCCKCNNTGCDTAKNKPKYSWLELIGQAFAQTKKQKLVTLVILCQIEKLYPYYRFAKDKSWKTSIVQCLSSSHYFIREQEKKCKDGFVWCVNQKFKEQLKQISKNGISSNEIHSLPTETTAPIGKKNARSKGNNDRVLTQSSATTASAATNPMFACSQTTVKSESTASSTYGGGIAYSVVLPPSTSSTIAATTTIVAGSGGHQLYCRHCSRLVYNYENYLYHWKQYHGNVSPMEMFDNTVHCSVCDFYLDSRRSYDEHCCSQFHIENVKRLSSSANNHHYGAPSDLATTTNSALVFNSRWAFGAEDVKPFAAASMMVGNVAAPHCSSVTAAPLPFYPTVGQGDLTSAAAGLHQHQVVSGPFDHLHHHHHHHHQTQAVDMTADCSEMKLLNVFSLLNDSA